MQATADFREQFTKLTDKQREVVRLLINCHSTKEIARILAISPSAVEQRLKGVRHRCGSMSRRQLQRHFRSTDAEALDTLFQPASEKISQSLDTTKSGYSQTDAIGPPRDELSQNKIHFFLGIIYGFALGLLTAAATVAIACFTMKLII